MGSIAFFLVGFLDDRYKLSAFKKILLLSFVSLGVCFFSENIIIYKFYLFYFDFFFQLKSFSIIFTILCILCLVNALNLADGINGLATIIIFFWLIYLNSIYYLNINIFIYLIIYINLLLILFYNLNGKHFLGDSGSLMLASLIALLTIYLHNLNINNPNHRTSAESLAIIFLIPVLDMLRLFFQRMLNKRNPYEADNNHLHHYLNIKFRLKGALLIYFLFMNIPIVLSIYTLINKLIIISLVILIYFIFLFYYKKLNKNGHIHIK